MYEASTLIQEHAAGTGPGDADAAAVRPDPQTFVGLIGRVIGPAERVASADVSELSVDQRLDALRALAVVGRFVDAAQARLLADLDARQATDTLAGQRTTTWLAQHNGLPGWTADARVSTANALAAHFDRFAEALRRSEIDWSYCRALASASNERIVDALVDLQGELLARVPGRRYETWVRELRALCALLDVDGPPPQPGERDRLHLSETLDGLVDLRGTFVGSTAEELRQLLETETDRQYRIAQHDREQTPDLPMPTRTVLRARALLAILRRDAAGDGDAPQTHVNLDVEALGPEPEPGQGAGAEASASDRPEAPTAGTPPPKRGERSQAWFRRILGQRGHVLAPSARLADGNLWRMVCSPVIHAIVTSNGHEILHMARNARLATPAQRRAARIRDGGCVFPGCDAPRRWTQLHHVVPWNDGGPTDLPLLATLCTHHHGVTHRAGWAMHPNLGPDGEPDGTFRWETPSKQTLWSQQHGEWAADPP